MQLGSIKNLIFAILISCFFTQVIAAPKKASMFFESSEHIASGDSVKLFYSANDPGQTGKILQMPNGLQLSYGDIVSFGDFYELLHSPIAFGKTAEERKLRFIKSFNSFAYSETVVSEAQKILKLLHESRRIIEDAMQRGEDPEAVFERMASESNRQLNCITGGGCAKEGWWLYPGRYLKLAETDYDHFGANAWISYKVGHQVAQEEALRAHETGDLNRLNLAYAMNAFACHFLSDRFAAGHIRSPRVELPRHVIPEITGTLLVHYMHNEENTYGLHVHNARGNKWIAYGDKTYFTDRNKNNREMLQQAMQTSALQIFHTFLTGEVQDDQAVHDFVPHPDEVKNLAVIDISPLFYWDPSKNKLMRRLDLANVYDRRWTDDWWGWSTLLMLADLYGIPGQSQAQLARSDYAMKAVKDGLITEKVILESLKR